LDNNLWLFLAGVIGIATSIAFVYITQYYTEYRYRPVKFIAEASQTGPATNIIAGLAVGLECTALPVLTISAALVSAYYCGIYGLKEFADISRNGAGLYGTAIATMGMLGTAAYILAMDTFGPITDNAGGIVEMSKQPEEIRNKTDRLDAVGNTTKALTKGYAIGSAALAAFLLFSAYMDEVTHLTGKLFDTVDIAQVQVFVGGLLGAMLVFLFSALAIRAVARAAYYVISDVRAQFKENPGILEGSSKPNYARCVDIVTKGALKEMIPPGLLAVCMPIAVGLVFKQFGLGAETVAAFLMVGTIGGILLATLMNNGGGAWDNAKKFVELGHYGGKKSETHKATVVGDTVGDPFKDTAGPSIHVLIKLLSTITLVLAPLFI
jgi:K(+)-stimulated pyrophosphate-energized sodium pump